MRHLLVATVLQYFSSAAAQTATTAQLTTLHSSTSSFIPIPSDNATASSACSSLSSLWSSCSADRSCICTLSSDSQAAPVFDGFAVTCAQYYATATPSYTSLISLQTFCGNNTPTRATTNSLSTRSSSAGPTNGTASRTSAATSRPTETSASPNTEGIQSM
jgi:hypothetical protein